MAEKMQYAGDVCFISGKFKNDQGEEKNRYVKCGVYFQAGDRIGIKMEFIPVGFSFEKGLWFSMFPKKDGKPPAQKAPPKQAPADDGAGENEIPF
jgi:hypothetical protein